MIIFKGWFKCLKDKGSVSSNLFMSFFCEGICKLSEVLFIMITIKYYAWAKALGKADNQRFRSSDFGIFGNLGQCKHLFFLTTKKN